MSRFEFIKYDDARTKKQKHYNDQFRDLERLVEQVTDTRTRSMILTKLEEAYLWVGKALRDEQAKETK